MRRVSGRGIGVASLLLAGSLAFAASSVGPWNAVLALGEGHGPAAVARADALQDVMLGLANGLTMDEPSTALLREVREATLELDLRRLHTMLPIDEGSSDFRRLDVLGVSQGDTRYDLTLYPSQASMKQAPRMGRVEVSLYMAKRQLSFARTRGFEGRVRGEVGTGSVAWTHAMAMGEDTLAQIYTLAWSDDPAASTLSACRTWFPTTTALFERFMLIDGYGSWHGEVFALDARFRVNRDALRASRYAALAKYLDKLNNLMTFDLELLDEHGHALMSMSGRTKDSSTRFRANTSEGWLYPRGAGAEEAFRPTDVTEMDMQVRVAGRLQHQGMIIELKDYRIPVAFKSGEGKASLYGTLSKVPEIKFSGQGAFMSVIVSAAAGALSLEKNAQELFRAMAEGPKGKGSPMRAHWITGAGNDSKMLVKGDTLMADNAFVRMGAQIAGRYLVPNDEVLFQALELQAESITAVSDDYSAARPALLAVSLLEATPTP